MPSIKQLIESEVSVKEIISKANINEATEKDVDKLVKALKSGKTITSGTLTLTMEKGATERDLKKALEAFNKAEGIQIAYIIK